MKRKSPREVTDPHRLDVFPYGLVLAAGAGLVMASCRLGIFDLLGFVPDDTAYYLNIARNWAGGLGSTFDGIHPTNGYQPLWQWFLIPLFALVHGSAEAMLRLVLAVQVVLLVLAAFLTLRVWRRGLCEGTRAILMVLFLFFVFVQAMEGMEGALLILLLSALADAGLKSGFWISRRPGAAILVGILLGLVMLARLDSVFLAFGVGVVVAVRGLAPAGDRAVVARNLLLVVGASTLVVAPYLIGNQAAFGHPAPISVQLKSGFPHLANDLSLTKVPLRDLGFAILAIAASLVGWRSARPSPEGRALYYALIAGTIGVVLHQANTVLFLKWAIFPWHFLMDRYVGILGLGFLLDPVLRRFRGGLAAGGVVAVCSLMLAVAVGRTWERYRSPEGNWHVAAYEAALWARDTTPETTLFAMKDAGNFGYFSERRTINLDGLVNGRDFQDALGEGDALGYLRAQGVGFLVHHAFEETPEMVAGGYDFFVMEYYSHLHERMADPIVLPREAEVYRSRPYPHAGGETRLRVFDLAKIREAP